MGQARLCRKRPGQGSQNPPGLAQHLVLACYGGCPPPPLCPAATIFGQAFLVLRRLGEYNCTQMESASSHSSVRHPAATLRGCLSTDAGYSQNVPRLERALGGTCVHMPRDLRGVHLLYPRGAVGGQGGERGAAQDEAWPVQLRAVGAPPREALCHPCHSCAHTWAGRRGGRCWLRLAC